jgi:hypothetical protein
MMSPDTGHEAHHHHKNRHLAEKFEGFIGIAMVAAIVVLGAILIYGLINTGSSTPSWMQ